MKHNNYNHIIIIITCIDAAATPQNSKQTSAEVLLATLARTNRENREIEQPLRMAIEERDCKIQELEAENWELKAAALGKEVQYL